MVGTALKFISESDLKEIVTRVLTDSVAGPILRKELVASTERTLEFARVEARDISMNIQNKAYHAIGMVIEEAIEMDGMESGSAWANALYVHVRKIKDLAEQGPLVDACELAWEALVHVADLCILPEQVGDVKLEDDEEVCDTFHDDVDNVMLHICKLQEANGRRSWLQDPARKQEIWELREKPEPPLDFKEGKSCTYRYRKTLKFLDNNGTDN